MPTVLTILQLYIKLLHAAGDNGTTSESILQVSRLLFNLPDHQSDWEKKQYKNRVAWAKAALTQGGYITGKERIKLTESGKNLAKQDNIDIGKVRAGTY